MPRTARSIVVSPMAHQQLPYGVAMNGDHVAEIGGVPASQHDGHWNAPATAAVEYPAIPRDQALHRHRETPESIAAIRIGASDIDDEIGSRIVEHGIQVLI